MKGKLQQYFLSFLSFVILIIVIYAIFGPKEKQINIKDISFNTTDSSELYFKNLRSYYYDQEIREDANFVLYRIRSRNKDSLSYKLNFALVSNWLMDECYIISESQIPEIILVSTLNNKSDTLSLVEYDSEANYIFAATLFERLTTQAELFLVQNSEKIAFTEKEKLSLKTTLKDYFKLVGKLR